MPARGNEKPDAESTVKAVQKRCATPVPRVADLNELNMFFRKWCETERDRVVQSLLGPFTIRDRLADDLAAATPLGTHQFDACVIRPAVAVDKYQTVAFDGNRYSVPRAFAFGMVAVKGYVDQVVIVAGGQVVASHRRCHAKAAMILEPIHYLATLGRKPGALDHSPVFRDWKLPACFAEFRTRLEGHHGVAAGSRRFVKVLQLLGEHPMARVSLAIEACQRDHLDSVEAVIQRTVSLGAIEAAKRTGASPAAEASATPPVQVPPPDLGRFDQLLNAPGSEEPISVFFA
jgi:hypothetical protein